jgi:hypothetical protein
MLWLDAIGRFAGRTGKVQWNTLSVGYQPVVVANITTHVPEITLCGSLVTNA